MDHALAGPQRGKWLVSRDAEYNSQMENHTWDLVYLPNGKKAIQCNKGAIAMAHNAVLHGLNKHMRIKWHWLRKEMCLDCAWHRAHSNEPRIVGIGAHMKKLRRNV
ncbi:hypothetical protein CLOM_g10512 [Closterium sp. NIES-68]|nr:hypothetical protein CLOM_g10512 [Closterium sp. NIES-68]